MAVMPGSCEPKPEARHAGGCEAGVEPSGWQFDLFMRSPLGRLLFDGVGIRKQNVFDSVPDIKAVRTNEPRSVPLAPLRRGAFGSASSEATFVAVRS